MPDLLIDLMAWSGPARNALWIIISASLLLAWIFNRR